MKAETLDDKAREERREREAAETLDRERVGGMRRGGAGVRKRFARVAMAEGLANEILLLRLAVYRAVRLGHEAAIERAVDALVGALAAERRGGYAEASLEAMLAAAAEEVLEEP